MLKPRKQQAAEHVNKIQNHEERRAWTVGWAALLRLLEPHYGALRDADANVLIVGVGNLYTGVRVDSSIWKEKSKNLVGMCSQSSMLDKVA